MSDFYIKDDNIITSELINPHYEIKHADFEGITIKLEGNHSTEEIHEFLAVMLACITPNKI